MKLSAQVGDEERPVVVEPLGDPDAGRWRVVLDGKERIVDGRRLEGGAWSLVIDGQAYLVDIDRGKDDDLVVEVRGVQVTLKILDERRRLMARARDRRPGASGPQPVRSPMPGKVAKVLVKPGETVTAGQGLVVVEAMKMENELRAPRDGRVQTVHVAEGQPVEAQEALVTLE